MSGLSESTQRPRGRRSFDTVRRLARRLVASRVELPLIVLWLALGSLLAALTTRVVDWYVMTDELQYERLAISIARSGSPLPAVHGSSVSNLNQLFPTLLATVFGHGLVPGSFYDAHLLDAFVMSSAAIPAFLLARRVTDSRAAAYLAAVLAACVPWTVYASFLLTEVVAYPAFLWAVLGMQRAIVGPSRRSDVLALCGLALAVLARTQFVVLGAVLPVAVAGYELAGLDALPRGRRPLEAVRRAGRKHRVLAWVYGAGLVALLVLIPIGHASSLLGSYSSTATGNVIPPGFLRASLENLGVLAISVAILPFVLGGAWLLANAARPSVGERYAFALLATAAIVVLTVEVGIFDVRFGANVVHDRYLFYLVPLLLVALASLLVERTWPRWSLLVPAGLACAGMLVARLPVYGVLNIDTPASDIDHYLVKSLHSVGAARGALVGATLVTTGLFVAGTRLLPRRRLVALVAVLVLAAVPAEAALAFKTLFDERGTSGRPVTGASQGNVLDWIDQNVGIGSNVTMIPYPFLDGDYWASTAYWWDAEFWNVSVDRAAYLDSAFEGTPPGAFPQLSLRFDPLTGRADISPTEDAVQLESESRFRLYGNVRLTDRGALLIDTGGDGWLAQWITFGLYDDGWTKPGVVGRVRIFPVPGQSSDWLRTLVVDIRSPTGGRPVELSSNAGTWRGRLPAQGTVVASVPVCAPAHGFTDVRIKVGGATAIHGDMRSLDTFGAQYRTAGVYLARINVQGIGTSCPRRR